MVSIPSMPGRFFRRGNENLLRDLQRAVSIPSMPGRFFRRGLGDSTKTQKQKVSIPSMPGRFFRLQIVRNPWGRKRRPFQSPRCRGASSDISVWFDADTDAEAFQSPRCRGASSDAVLRPVPGHSEKFQSPRCRGASADIFKIDKDEIYYEKVSIPSMPGRFFRPVLLRSAIAAAGYVSIPSMPGRFFRRLHEQAGMGRRGPGFNPLDAGALLQTTPDQFLCLATNTGFQSPRCRGASSDD